jgi:hypothetical protein
MQLPIVPHPAEYDFSIGSDDLARDIMLMWETRPRDKRFASDDLEGVVSTDAAINAASRVFNTAQLIGKSRADVIKLLGDPEKRENYIYSQPFWPVTDRAIVYRFDSGAYGWQFNILFDEHETVVRVEREWIH